jgi:hypothetical protein
MPLRTRHPISNRNLLSLTIVIHLNVELALTAGVKHHELRPGLAASVAADAVQRNMIG